MVASARLTEDDLIEAVGQVGPEAVEALVYERGEAFRPNADMLVRLADAGVPGSLIDLVVALSYPGRFEVKSGSVDELTPGNAYAAVPMGYGVSSRYSFWNPYFYDPYYSGYGRWGMSPYSYGYGGYGYGGYGYRSGYYYRPTTVVVQPTGSLRYPGSMVKGQGYTRGGSRSGGSSSSGSSGGASASSGSSGSRGSSGSSGRTAVRRGGGGGGL